MPKKMILSLLAVLFLVGCTGSAGIKVRGYMEDKKRVDQNLLTGNSGYLVGAPDELPQDRKETRKIYILEMTKENENLIEDTYVPRASTAVPTYKREPKRNTRRVVAPEPEFVIPSFDDDMDYVELEPVKMPSAKEVAGPKTFAVYTVEKNDTLQKISKKFYDSFSKWPRIYEANRLKIKNPDALVVGTVLKIPVK